MSEITLIRAHTRGKNEVLGIPVEFGERKIISQPAQRCLCVETGEIFESMRAAAKAKDISYGSVQAGIEHGYRGGGYHWEKVD